MTFKPEKVEEDKSKPSDIVTMELMTMIADDVDDMLKFTFDAPSNHESNKMPVLDMKVWLDNEKRIKHEFYEKLMKNNLVIHKESVIPYKSKMKNSLRKYSEEYIIRMNMFMKNIRRIF